MKIGYLGKSIVALAAMEHSLLNNVEVTEVKKRDYDLPSSPPAMRRRVQRKEIKTVKHITSKLQSELNKRQGYGMRKTKKAQG